MHSYEFISNTEQETKDFAKNFAKQLDNQFNIPTPNKHSNSPTSSNYKTNKNAVIVLTGELGSGKTKFVEGFLSYFGLENEISSPTFTIVNEYSNSNTCIYHFDVYRLADISEFYEIGGEEYFENGICLIEWGELIKEALPKNTIFISFKKSDSNDNSRKLTIKWNK